MSRFSDLLKAAQDNSGIKTLQAVVEKELLHHDIIGAMARGGLLRHLTFIGGTCLRACYASQRLSDNLDFTGGLNFSADDLRDLNQVVSTSIKETYDLDVVISDPKRETGQKNNNVSTWKFQVITNAGSKHLPQQRIHVDICAVSSHQRQPMVLQNHYKIELGTSGLIIQTETLHEILQDKILALAMRPNRIKHRDVWDICWLTQQQETANRDLIFAKCEERKINAALFQSQLSDRLELLPTLENHFRQEMTRFLAQSQLKQIDQDGYWDYVTRTLRELCTPLGI